MSAQKNKDLNAKKAATNKIFEWIFRMDGDFVVASLRRKLIMIIDEKNTREEVE